MSVDYAGRILCAFCAIEWKISSFGLEVVYSLFIKQATLNMSKKNTLPQKRWPIDNVGLQKLATNQQIDFLFLRNIIKASPFFLYKCVNISECLPIFTPLVRCSYWLYLITADHAVVSLFKENYCNFNIFFHFLASTSCIQKIDIYIDLVILEA